MKVPALFLFVSLNLLSQSSISGVRMNGLQYNGIAFNGTTLNGINFNGMRLNGVNLNGARFNGIKQFNESSAMNAGTITHYQLANIVRQGIVK